MLAMADIHRRRADYPNAEAALVAALDQIQALASPSDLIAGWNNLAGIVAKETGQFAQAEQRYRTALHLCGTDDELRASVLHNLAGLAYMWPSSSATSATSMHKRGGPKRLRSTT